MQDELKPQTSPELEKRPLFETDKEAIAFELRMRERLKPVLERLDEEQRRSWELASRIFIG